MPRESVYGTDPDNTAVKVGWDQNGNVQVGVSSAGEFTFTQPLPATVSVNGPYDGLWVTLNRHGINCLIRHLRRARDAAFGSDE
jgi:hypothetical protein